MTQRFHKSSPSRNPKVHTKMALLGGFFLPDDEDDEDEGEDECDDECEEEEDEEDDDDDDVGLGVAVGEVCVGEMVVFLTPKPIWLLSKSNTEYTFFNKTSPSSQEVGPNAW